jgi:hypothetical protein
MYMCIHVYINTSNLKPEIPYPPQQQLGHEKEEGGIHAEEGIGNAREKKKRCEERDGGPTIG